MANIVPDSFKQELFLATHNFNTASGFTVDVLTTSVGYNITVLNANNYTFNAYSGTAILTGVIGGPNVTAQTI